MDLHTLKQTALTAVQNAPDLAALEAARLHYMGQKGQITALLKELGSLTGDERKARGAEVNAVREAFVEALEGKKQTLENAEISAKLATEKVDITLPADAFVSGGLGKLHPLSAAMDEIAAALRQLGFTHAYGPEIETDEYNFTKLNLPAHHPARQDQDTFYVAGYAPKNAPENDRFVLRTQTSNVQIHALETYAPPFRVMGIGRVFRRDYDATHTPQFHQVEGMMVDKGVTMAHMRGVLDEFLRLFFGKQLKTRMRPHYFPFTEPSAEMDMECLFCKGGGCKVCKHSGWLEVLGCGMVHRNVLAEGGINNLEQFSGFAFGAGVERLAMLKYGVPDLRVFYESHGAFLQSFGKSAVSIS
jgi:phenylalanyl-tRNA synthetase alpha chain